jgi:hypothetical protein
MRSFHASQASRSACACAFFAASSLMRHEMRRLLHDPDMGQLGRGVEAKARG